jgi:hypothetical protein
MKNFLQIKFWQILAVFTVLLLNCNNMFATHTLTNSEVEVVDGVLKKVTYKGTDRDIIIPSYLDDQTITELGYQIFGSSPAMISDLKLPSSLKIIQANSMVATYIKSVNIPSGVTEIGSRAFAYNRLSTITIPSSVEIIGDRAFNNGDLTSVTFSGTPNIKKIGAYAFKSDEGLSSVSFTYNPNVIPNFKYWYSDGKKYTSQFTITDFTEEYKAIAKYTLTDNDVVVENGKITSVSYDFSDQYIAFPNSLDGQYITEIHRGFKAKKLIELELPDSLKIIGDTAFYSNIIAFANLPDALVNIGKNAFYNNKLENINIGKNVKRIEANAFYMNNLNSVTFSSDAVLSYIGESAFEGNKDARFFAANNITSITLPATIDTIGDYAFYKNSLSSVTIPDSTISIGKFAFAQNDLNSLDIPEKVKSLDIACFAENKLTTVTFNGSIKTIADSAFFTNNITALTLLEGTEDIGVKAFYNNLIDSLTIPASVTTINEDAFSNNYGYSSTSQKIMSLVFAENSQLKYVGDKAFEKNKLSIVIFPKSLEYIGYRSFNSNAIDSVNLNDCNLLSNIGFNAFSSNASELKNIHVPQTTLSGFIKWIDSDDSTYTGAFNITDFSNSYKAIISHTLTDNDVEVIDNNIINCTYDFLGSVITIPDTLDNQLIKGITASQFANKNIFNIKLPSKLEYIGANVFSSNKLSEIDIPASVTYIGEAAFDNNKLAALTLPKNVHKISKNAFSNNELTYVEIPNKVDTIEMSAFAMNKFDSILVIPENVNYVGNSAFDGSYSNDNLDTVIFKSTGKLHYIGKKAFESRNYNSFVLPVAKKRYYEFNEWKTNYYDKMQPGDTVPTHKSYAAQFTQKITEIYNLSGTVTNADDILITFKVNNEIYDSILCNSNSTYNFEAGVGEQITITPKKEGYVFEPSYYYISPSQDSLSLDFEALKAYTLEGMVTGVSDGNIRADIYKGSNKYLSITSDSTQYKFTVGQGQMVKIYPYSKGYAFTPQTVEIDSVFENRTNINFEGYKACNISGYLDIDSTYIYLTYNDTVQDTIFRKNISYYATVPYGANVKLSAHKDGYKFSPESHVIDSIINDTSHVSFTSQKAYELSGTITGADNVKLLFSSNNEIIDSIMVESDGDSYSYIAVKNETITIKAVKEGYTIEPTEYTIADIETDSTGLDFNIVENFTLSGTVYNSPNSSVRLYVDDVLVNNSYIDSDSSEYAFEVKKGSDISIKVTRYNFVFEPETITIDGVVADSANLDFVGTRAYFNAKFLVIDEENNPIDSALININDTSLMTGYYGNATLDNLKINEYQYTVNLEGFTTYIDTLVFTTENAVDTIVLKEIPTVTQLVTFNVTEGTNNLENAEISINNTTLITSAEGIATVELPEGDYTYTALLQGYITAEGNITISDQAVNEAVELAIDNSILYTVEFKITDSDTVLNNAAIAINDTTIYTDSTGYAQCNLVNGDYIYTVSLNGYNSKSNTITVAMENVLSEIELNVIPEGSLLITFTVTDGANILPGATITIDGEDLIADENGIVSTYLLSNTYTYTITLEGYADITDEVAVNDADVDIEITMTLISSFKEANSMNFSYYPNPATSNITVEMTTESDVKSLVIYSATGSVLFYSDNLNRKMLIDISSFPSGILLLKALNADGISISKQIVKQ